MSIVLHAFNNPENARKHKCLAAAALAGLAVEVVDAPIPTSQEFKDTVSPAGGTPALVTADGSIFETNAVLRFIARNDKSNTLYGKNAFESSRIDAWLDLSLSELDIFSTHIANHFICGLPMPADWLESIECALAGPEKWLEGKTFFVGENITIADLCIAFALQTPLRLTPHGEHLAAKFPNVFRMYSAVMANETVAATLKAHGGAPFAVKKDE